MFKLWTICAALDFYFVYSWFNSHDAGFGAAILTGLNIWFFYSWFWNIVSAKEAEERRRLIVSFHRRKYDG